MPAMFAGVSRAFLQYDHTIAADLVPAVFLAAGNRYLLCGRAMLCGAIGGSCEQKRHRRIRTADSKLEVCSLPAFAAKLDL
jgi:hypothetical protein